MKSPACNNSLSQEESSIGHCDGLFTTWVEAYNHRGEESYSFVDGLCPWHSSRREQDSVFPTKILLTHHYSAMVLGFRANLYSYIYPGPSNLNLCSNFPLAWKALSLYLFVKIWHCHWNPTKIISFPRWLPQQFQSKSIPLYFPQKLVSEPAFYQNLVQVFFLLWDYELSEISDFNLLFLYPSQYPI